MRSHASLRQNLMVTAVEYSRCADYGCRWAEVVEHAGDSGLVLIYVGGGADGCQSTSSMRSAERTQVFAGGEVEAIEILLWAREQTESSDLFVGLRC